MLRLYVYVAAFFGLLAAPFLLQSVVRERSELRPEQGGEMLELRIITPHNQEIRRTFELAFSDWHLQHFGRGVAITYLSPGGSNDIVRYLRDLYGSYRDAAGKLVPEEQVSSGIDLVWGGGDYTFERDFKPMLKPLLLSPALLQAAFPRSDLAGVALYDPDTIAHGSPPRWVGIVLSSFGLIYSPDFYAALRLPAPDAWEDLARPELKGLLALADPTRSGSAAVAYMMVLQRAMETAERRWLREHPELGYDEQSQLRPADEASPSYRAALARGWKEGMRTLLLMAANARYFGDSASRPCVDVGDAEAAAGVAIDFYARVFQDQIGKRRITYHAPRGATAITPDPIGVLYGTRGERELVANRFVEFLLTPESQRLWNLDAGQSPYVPRSLRRLPVRRDVYLDRTGWADDENPFELAQGFNMRQRWTRQLGKLVPIWAAAWIDAKPELDQAYAALLALPDPARREQLRQRLADLPIELDELTRPPAPASEPDARTRAARERMGWSTRFREHYLDVLRAAREAR
ncbi:MAG TPA: ABC transporter substrate-binding protein [Polyangiaceae bacterium]|nr:ABC transporter substrate-binding protein [Polyangiaceae bacterium]